MSCQVIMCGGQILRLLQGMVNCGQEYAPVLSEFWAHCYRCKDGCSECLLDIAFGFGAGKRFFLDIDAETG